ncbi:hypothetical protein DV517_74540 [Streptomyces sp. S816]|uniref:hypothetical protein n=1 Tax=Streptomyces sp. S816 TaxID=2283197 RepID=UPI00109C413B|nr:hypothetical protein [Streptomyces sp. S816]TGZ12359.1 hypothetical protein DV517_74540 [Streptomyces sp. S816]
MSKSNPFKDRQARKAAGTTVAVPGQQGIAPAAPKGDGHSHTPAGRPFAQGRPEKMMTLADLPEPIETPDATGDLSDEEEQILALCMRGVQQFEDAWWVMGKAMANINSRRLYRKTHATFGDFAQDVFNKSRPIAYEEMTAYAIGELLSARADKPFEGNSNEVSARADTLSIGKKAAGALNPITKDYGPETSVAVHETIKDATGKTVTVKAITGIVQQVPRKEDKELSQDELTALVRELAANTPQPGRDRQTAGQQASALEDLRGAVTHLEAAHRALAPARIKKALEENAEEAAKILASAKETADKAVARINSSLPKTS